MDRLKLFQACELQIDLEARPLLYRSFTKFAKKRDEIIDRYSVKFSIPSDQFHSYLARRLYDGLTR